MYALELPNLVKRNENRLQRDHLSSFDVVELLEEHLRRMQAQTPPESVHALDLSALRQLMPFTNVMALLNRQHLQTTRTTRIVSFCQNRCHLDYDGRMKQPSIKDADKG